MSERTNIFGVYDALRATSVCSRAVERSYTPGAVAPVINVSRQGIINLAP